MGASFIEQLAIAVIVAVLGWLVIFIRRRWTFSGFMKPARLKRNQAANLLQRLTMRLGDIVRYYETNELESHPDQDNMLRHYADEFLAANGELAYALFQVREFMTESERPIYAGYEETLRSVEVDVCRYIHQRFEYGWINRYVITKADFQDREDRREKAQQGIADAKRFLEFCRSSLIPTLWKI